MELNLNSIEREEKENPFIAKFEQFFHLRYKKEIERLASVYPEKNSLNIDFNELERFDFELAEELISNPDYLTEAAREAIKSVDIPNLGLEIDFVPNIRFYNLPKDREVLLRNIGSEHLGKLISVEGVIRQITDVLPKLKLAVWECTKCGNTYKVSQEGQSIKKPSICECKNKEFDLLEDKSVFIDYQKIQIQEPLEKLRGNEQPTTLNIYVSDDLVNKVSAGDKTRFVGVIRLLVPRERKVVYGRFLEAIHLDETEKEFSEVEVSKEEEEQIKELSKNPQIYDILVQSIAPNIYGHEIVKEAIALQLFGGVKKLLPNNTTIRGNIHLLIVGDPGLAKSALLQATNEIAPKSIYVAGKTSSGVGLTASAVKDDFGEGGWTLKAGALVLASGGLALIDEFDKMEPEDRGAMHEAMEQGRVSVAKAGIVTSFKTDTSILAAANPKYSRFDPYQSFLEQIDLPSTLISRFDLFFPIKDVLDRTKDKEIASHILQTHKTGEMLIQSKIKGKTLTEEQSKELKRIIPIIDNELLKKFISFARQNVFPILEKESIQMISDFYIDLRDQGRKEGAYSATHRQLEGLVRLSEASARVRLSDKVELEDVKRAIKLVKYSLEELVTDPETGKIDIDILTAGITHTQINNLKAVLKIIKDLAETQEMVSIQEVIEQAKNEGIGEEEKIREYISTLKKKGDLYEPRHNFLKPTSKK